MAVQQSRFGKHKGAGADRSQLRAAFARGLQRSAGAGGNPPDSARALSAEATISIRPEYIELVEQGGYVDGEVIEQIYAGSETRLLVKLGSGTVMTVRQAAGSRARHVGATVSLQWRESHSRLLEK